MPLMPPDAYMAHAFHRWQELRLLIAPRYVIAVYYVDGQHWMTFQADAIRAFDNWDGRIESPPDFTMVEAHAFFCLDRTCRENVAANLRRIDLRLHVTYRPTPMWERSDQVGPGWTGGTPIRGY